MRKILLLVAVAAVAAPGAALAKKPQPGTTTTTTTTTSTQTSAPTPSAKSLALASCKTQRTQMGLATYKATYGSAGLARCVAKTQGTEQSQLTDAAHQCKAMRSDTDAWNTYVGTHPDASGKTFAQYFGSNTKSQGQGAGANAFGKCVSSLAKAAAGDHTSAVVGAAKQCKLDRKDATTFATKWGSGKNAFGKCVSAGSKA